MLRMIRNMTVIEWMIILAIIGIIAACLVQGSKEIKENRERQEDIRKNGAKPAQAQHFGDVYPVVVDGCKYIVVTNEAEQLAIVHAGDCPNYHRIEEVNR